MVGRKLESDIEYTRKAIIQRARSLVDDLTRLADRLEADSDAGINTIGVLQGSGVELDTCCAKLGVQRETLKRTRARWPTARKTRRADPCFAGEHRPFGGVSRR